MIDVQDHISHRVTRSRVELQLRRSIPPLMVYLGGLLVMAACIAFIGSNLRGGALSGGRTVQFAVPDVRGVVPGRAELRYKGIPAGVIDEAELRGGQAVLTVRIQERWGPVYRDARAELRPGTPLQDMYLDITDRGTPTAGEAAPDEPISKQQTTSSVNVADVLQVFDTDTRSRLRTLLDEFGNGLDDRGASLRGALIEVVPLLDGARRAARQIEVREQRTRRLVHNFRLLTEELGERDTAVRRLVREGSETLSALETSSPDLDATLRRLPGTLGRLDSSFAALRAVLPPVDTALRDLRPAVDALPSALAAARALQTDADPAVGALRPAVRRLTPLARTLQPLSTDLSSAIAALSPQVADVDKVTTSVSKCGYTLQRFFQWTQSVFSLGDVRGEAPRGDAAVGLDTTEFLSSPRVTIAPTCAGGNDIGGAPPKRRVP